MKNSLPSTLTSLETLAKNYWFSWNQQTSTIFEKLNPEHWGDTHCPYSTLQNASEKTLKDLSEDQTYIADLESVSSELNSYMQNKQTWYNSVEGTQKEVAYFCAEYGINESLPIYSGGLGILAGDHIKASSDLGIPITFIGLFYHQGYFKQLIDKHGRQNHEYPERTFESTGATRAKDPKGNNIAFEMNLANEKVKVEAWQLQVGRNTLYLLTTNVEGNSEKMLDLTARLYGGDREMRIAQEVVLGMGGMKLLNILEKKPDCFHANEGHSIFFQLSRIEELMKKGVSFDEAKYIVASNTVFTTHTPVPAGNEAFGHSLVHKYFHKYCEEVNIDWKEFLELGHNTEDPQNFGLTIMSLKLSRFHNGVSKLHGEIAQEMWQNLWNNVPFNENPITSITNGVHVPTWTAKEMKNIFAKHMGNDWEQHLSDDAYWDKIRSLPTEVFTDTRKNLKNKLIQTCRKNLKTQIENAGGTKEEVKNVDTFLNTDTLLIGFARRFATYKRATLIFSDLTRLDSIINHSDRPVAFLFAGKAHPKDVDGQAFIQRIHEVSKMPQFLGKIILLENYDMMLSRDLVSGVDVWLNNPRRPLEASGTSGQKVPLNGGINFSVLDGWWREGHNGENGWPIGIDDAYPSLEQQDFEDAQDFYKKMEETIAPMYYDAPEEWAKVSYNSLISNLPKFSANRMLKDYWNLLYKNAINYRDCILGISEEYTKQKKVIKKLWPFVHVENLDIRGDFEELENKDDEGRTLKSCLMEVNFDLYTANIDPSLIRAEMITKDSFSDEYETHPLTVSDTQKAQEGIISFKAPFHDPNHKQKEVKIRVYPYNEKLASKFELRHMLWV
jgi:glycogen phosphorylase